MDVPQRVFTWWYRRLGKRYPAAFMAVELQTAWFITVGLLALLNLYYDVPATCYGPLGGNLHAPDEWVDLESVRQVTKVLAATAMAWCGVASEPAPSAGPAPR